MRERMPCVPHEAPRILEEAPLGIPGIPRFPRFSRFPMFGLGVTELVVLLVVVLLLFGPSRLPQLMESLGKSIQSFRRGLQEPPEIDVTPREGEAPGSSDGDSKPDSGAS